VQLRSRALVGGVVVMGHVVGCVVDGRAMRFVGVWVIGLQGVGMVVRKGGPVMCVDIGIGWVWSSLLLGGSYGRKGVGHQLGRRKVGKIGRGGVRL